MTGTYTEDMLDETIKTLKNEGFKKVRWLATSPTTYIAVETEGYNVTVFHPGIVRFVEDGSLLIAGEGLPFMVISAGGWRDVTVMNDEMENA